MNPGYLYPVGVSWPGILLSGLGSSGRDRLGPMLAVGSGRERDRIAAANKIYSYKKPGAYKLRGFCYVGE